MTLMVKKKKQCQTNAFKRFTSGTILKNKTEREII